MAKITYQDKSYTEKRQILREYSNKDKITYYLDLICNECINGHIRLSTYNNEDETNLRPIFKDLVKKLGFNDQLNISIAFRDLMIDGYLAIEIIWDDKKENILSFNRLDPTSLVPAYDKENGNYWIQYPDNNNFKRMLFDQQVIYISYSSNTNSISYVESLIKPYNHLSILEESNIMLNIIKSSTVNKYTIPTKGLSKQKAEENISSIIREYNEEIKMDDSTGEVTLNGKKQIPYIKNIFLPEGDYGKMDLERMNSDITDNNFTSNIEYFENKLKMVSYIPINNSDIREVNRLNKFKLRLKTTFLEIIRKPLKLQAEKLNLNIDGITIDI